MIRRATVADLPLLCDMEERCFTTDRLSRRNFRYMLTKGNAVILVDDEDGGMRGYVLLLFNTKSTLVRLYSIAVDPRFRGHGVGRRLIETAEEVALSRDCAYMLLEIRVDNQASQSMFLSCGYRPYGKRADYYEDHQDAVLFEKVLAPHLSTGQITIPYYQQTLDFTCGPASLMMAMKALDSTIQLSRRLEIRIWREATTVFMMSGHGGCGPHGLALSAAERGFEVDMYVSADGPMFLDTVRSTEKKEVIRLVHEDFLDLIPAQAISVTRGFLSTVELCDKLNVGGIPIVLISSYRIYKEKFPHWVVITGNDERFIYVHDPFVNPRLSRTPADCINLPIPRKDFERMTRFGQSGQRASLILSKRA